MAFSSAIYQISCKYYQIWFNIIYFLNNFFLVLSKAFIVQITKMKYPKP